MGRKRTKNMTNKQDKQPVKTQTGLIEEQMETLNYRALMIFSTIGVACAIFCLLFFFNSDVRGKIVAAKTTPVVTAQSNTPNTAEVPVVSDSTDIASVLNDPNVSREAVIAHIGQMSDEGFEKFIKTATQKTDGTETSGTTDSLNELLSQNEQSKSAIISYLNELDKAEFDALIGAVVTAIHLDSKTPNSNLDSQLQKTLEDAYAEAERLYPGQIDGSKRLKLVEDLNATGYMYYVAEEGDTLIKLSNAFHVSLGQLVELNGIHDADVIPAGMVLLFPSDTEQPDIRK